MFVRDGPECRPRFSCAALQVFSATLQKSVEATLDDLVLADTDCLADRPTFDAAYSIFGMELHPAYYVVRGYRTPDLRRPVVGTPRRGGRVLGPLHHCSRGRRLVFERLKPASLRSVNLMLPSDLAIRLQGLIARNIVSSTTRASG